MRKTHKVVGQSQRRRKSRKSRNHWIIAIPSYKRAETLRDKTLKVLQDYNIQRKYIHIFVASASEYDIYITILDPLTYGHIHIAVPGMANVRNYITQYFPIGQRILNIDDDIKGFIEYSESSPRHERPLKSLINTITQGFAEIKRTGLRLFGFYPVSNGYFMNSDPPSTDLRYIIGSVWGIINPGINQLKVTIDDKEDYLRSLIMYLLDGGVIRFNNISPKSAYYKEPGGMQEERTVKRIEKSAKAIVIAFPGLVKINLTKKSGMAEVRLRDSRPESERVFGINELKKYKMPTI